MDTARDLFLQQGFKGTTLEAIIARAGGSRETVYSAFGGKHGLFKAIISDAGQRLASASTTPAAMNLPPREGLTKIAEDLVTIWRSPEGCAVNRVVASEGLDAPELVQAWFQGGLKLSLETTGRYLETQVQAGSLAAMDTALVARQFAMLLIGEMALPLVTGSEPPDNPAASIAHCVDLILRSYGRTPGP